MKRILTGIVSAAVVICVAAAWIIWSNSSFEETFYAMESYKIEETVRVIVLADLHQGTFGPDNETLLGRVRALKPDLLLIAGDLVNKRHTDWDYAAGLCGELSRIAPVYYAMGNHENEALYGRDLNKEFLDGSPLGENREDFSPLLLDRRVWETLESSGATVLQNASAEAEVKGVRIKIGGVSTNSSSFWPYSGQFITRFVEEDPEMFKILISHRPEPVVDYISDAAIDLAVSGHNHGGIIRIPGVGGLFSDAEGLFPTYDGGWYESGGMSLLISRGLGGHGLAPRVFNRPELVILDIN